MRTDDDQIGTNVFRDLSNPYARFAGRHVAFDVSRSLKQYFRARAYIC